MNLPAVPGLETHARSHLVERLAANAPLNTPDQATFYGGGAKGYTDYPTLQSADA